MEHPELSPSQSVSGDGEAGSESVMMSVVMTARKRFERDSYQDCVQTDTRCTCAPEQKRALELLLQRVPPAFGISQTCLLGPRIVKLAQSKINGDGKHSYAEHVAQGAAMKLDGAPIVDSDVRYCMIPRRRKHEGCNDRFLRSKRAD